LPSANCVEWLFECAPTIPNLKNASKFGSAKIHSFNLDSEFSRNFRTDLKFHPQWAAFLGGRVPVINLGFLSNQVQVEKKVIFFVFFWCHEGGNSINRLITDRDNKLSASHWIPFPRGQTK